MEPWKVTAWLTLLRFKVGQNYLAKKNIFIYSFFVVWASEDEFFGFFRWPEYDHNNFFSLFFINSNRCFLCANICQLRHFFKVKLPVTLNPSKQQQLNIQSVDRHVIDNFCLQLDTQKCSAIFGTNYYYRHNEQIGLPQNT